MSDEDKPLEFSASDLMPEWAKESSKPKEKKQRPRDDRGESRRDARGGGGDRRGGHGGDRRGGGDNRGGRDRRGGGQGRRDFGGGERRGGGRDDRGGGRGQRRGGRDDFRGRDRRERPPEDKPAQGIKATIEPSEGAIKGLTKHIRETYRAFPLADLAKMILSGRDRYQVCFETTDDGIVLYQCKDDNSVWLTREEAIKHLLSSDVLANYYEVEEVDVGAPSGNFSNIAVCGMSGEILGPPNHHEYQQNIARLHAERFSNMPLERFKSRIIMESGEEIVEKWKEKVSKKLQYRLKTEGAPEEAGETEKTEETEEKDDVLETPVGEEVIESPAVEDAPVVGEEVSNEKAPAEEEAEAADSDAEAADSEQAPEAAEAAEPEASSGGEETPEAEEESAAEAETAEDSGPAKEEGPLLKSPEELARHFKEHFATEAVIEAKKAVVPGNIQGRDLSRGLLVHLKQENEKLRRGFPLPMIQALCRDFEKEGLRFFKRGKKALHVSSVRPKGISESVSLTGQIQAIIDRILSKPGTKVVDLLVDLAEDFTRPEKDQAPETLELTDKAKSVLKDLRWLTSEGYVIEFPDTKLALGKQPKQGEQPPAKKKVPKKKAAEVKAPATVAKDETPPAKAESEVKVESPAEEKAEAPTEDPVPVQEEPVKTEVEAAETLSPEAPAETDEAPAEEVLSPEAGTEQAEEPEEPAEKSEKSEG